MRLPSKQELLRTYSTWDAPKQKRMSARISVKHGLAFLRLLRSGSSQRKSQQKGSPSRVFRGKHKLSPGDDRGENKRFKRAQEDQGEVSSNILMKDEDKMIKEQELQPENTTKLMRTETVSSQSTSSLLSGTKSGPSDFPLDQKMQYVPLQGPASNKHGLIDDSTVSSTLGPQNESFQGNPKAQGEQASLSSSESSTTFDRESELNYELQKHGPLWRNKRKSLQPRKVLRKVAPEEGSVSGNYLQEELQTQAEDSEMSIPTDEGEVLESGQKHGEVLKPEKVMLLRCTGITSVRSHSPPVMESDGESGQLNLFIDQDPMLAEGNYSCASDLTVVPSSSQGNTGTAPFPGLRFESIQGFTEKNNTGKSGQGNPPLLGDGLADVVNSSLLDESVPDDCLDNLLPGLNLLHVERAAAEGSSNDEKACSSREKVDKSSKVKRHKGKSPKKSKKSCRARRLDMAVFGDKKPEEDDSQANNDFNSLGNADKSHKVKKHKYKSPKKSKRSSSSTQIDIGSCSSVETVDQFHKKHKTKGHKEKSRPKRKKSTSPGKDVSSNKCSPLPKSPVFGRILPTGDWSSLENPVTSPCRVQLVDYLTDTQLKQPARQGNEENTDVPEVGSEEVEVHRVEDVIEVETAIGSDDQCSGVQVHEQSEHCVKELDEALGTSMDLGSLEEREESSQANGEDNQPSSSIGEGQSLPSGQEGYQSPAVRHDSSTECSSQASIRGQEVSNQVVSIKKSEEMTEILPVEKDEVIDNMSVEKDVKKHKPEKIKKAVRSRKPHGDVARGAGGWEHSLRQRPQMVKLFQVGGDSKTPKKGAQKVSPKKDRSQSLLQHGHSMMHPSSKEASDDVGSSLAALSPNRIRRWRKKEPRAVAMPPPLDEKESEGKEASRKTKVKVQDGEGNDSTDSFCRGQLVFGKLKGFCWWPGQIVHHYERNIREPPPPLTRWIQWFGDGKFTLLSLSQIAGFEDFSTLFSSSTFQKLSLYQKACYEALNLAAKRAGKEFDIAEPIPPTPPTAPSSIKERQEYKAKMLERCKVMQDWAFNQFNPEGPESIQPSEEEKKTPPIPKSPTPSPEKKKPDQKESFEDKRGESMKNVRAGNLTIEDICIGCGSTNLTAKHPLFVGGLCEVCRIEYLEVAYLYDCEGYQAHCCICAEGDEITLCDNQGCYHSYCTACMNYLVAPQESKRVSNQDPWSCYLCSGDRCHGYLTRRDDWQEQLVEFFNRDQIADFEPLRMYKPLLLADRRPIRVLSLFDGLGTGMLVLKELGFDVECYYASEVSEEAITVSTVRLKGQIKQIGDVQKITPKELKLWGPFDLLIGGSPCNDLSIVNPARKGLGGGTGLLFFDFYRILRDLQPLPDDPRPFFWLFENVVFMGRKDKFNICRFLQCNPVMIDSRHMSPTHRARYYWGNLPGMHRPYVAGADNPLYLQECLEPHCDRQAQFSKVGTITTNANSIPQTKDAILPVIMNGREDGLWSTELERLFGFPEHYTDIGNLGRAARQKLLGKAWSVPVIKHLMAPLKDYFACSGQKE
ncbi:DNA (cytosine-5)-methyltransferase 3A-like [Lytechinus variegatus]|uniref:DNA (cytosine-5)-methyltransferase 3A-like n=1 Tax=Lytechinus variegatus TaxID=7654 RepID=UPI001BB2A9B7|nr:DNA (cytosine-5)-methyltransferase 3A-like [Lytechinus variegatus]XP_041474404.1 DNA (cytosine-5)-methyltransferase 3A-like [Lytechinus variegatus]